MSYSHDATYAYDSLNRLTTAVATPFGSGNISYNLNFNNYDRFGNMTCVQNAQTNGPCPQWTFNSNTNQLSTSSGFAYDAAGDLSTDASASPAYTYQWDAEGRITSVTQGSTSVWSFTYNAVGDRVQWAYPTYPKKLWGDAKPICALRSAFREIIEHCLLDCSGFGFDFAWCGQSGYAVRCESCLHAVLPPRGDGGHNRQCGPPGSSRYGRKRRERKGPFRSPNSYQSGRDKHQALEVFDGTTSHGEERAPV